jgi:acyl-coenzyme A thioesterase PaaI-like protein
MTRPAADEIGRRSEPVHNLNMWLGRSQDPECDDPTFASAMEAMRLLQERLTCARPDPETSERIATKLHQLGQLLEPFAVDESRQVAGRQLNVFGRGQSLVPGCWIDDLEDDSVSGRISFGRFYSGSNMTAHGGATALFFDDLLGQLANLPHRPKARTAYLRVDYRNVVPLNTEVRFSAKITEEVGRKLTVTGELTDADMVLASAEGLFIRLRAGQV